MGKCLAVRLLGPKMLDGTELSIEHCAYTYPLGRIMLN